MFDYKSALLSLVFVSNLSLGSKGTDVISLQQFLVSKGFLEIPAGVSYGYFGPLTKAAVAKWQADIGISPAVGYFGPISRAAIAKQTTQQAIAANPIPAPTPATTPSPFPAYVTDTPAAPGMRANRVLLFRAFPFEVRLGDVVTLDGSGFSKTRNEISFNGSNSLIATSTNGTALKFTVPSLSEGEYRLSISNILGSTDNPKINIKIKVTNNPHPAPVITNAFITGDIITLVGTGFTSSNQIITTFGSPSNPVSSNGTTLTFLITDLPRYNQLKQLPRTKHRKAPLWIYVKNEHGINKDAYKLEVII